MPNLILLQPLNGVDLSWPTTKALAPPEDQGFP
jgi:hypothetical protein